MNPASHTTDWQRILTSTGVGILLHLSLVHALGVAFLACGATLQPWFAGMALGCATILALGGVSALLDVPLPAAVGLGIAWALALGLSACVDDYSWDGQTYHLEAIIALGEGWNPLRETYDAVRAPGYPPGTQSLNKEWIEHYPMASWVIGSIPATLTGTLATAKATGLLLLLAAFLVTAPVLAESGLSPSLSLLAALAATANPVSLAQIHTNYVDGSGASLLLILCAGLFLMVRDGPRRRPMLIVLPALGLLLNLKFTMIPMAGILCLAACGCAWCRNETGATVRMAAILLAGSLVSVLALGYAPYVKNTLTAGHPFHPLAGARMVDFMPQNTPPGLMGMTWPGRVVVSMLGPTADLDEITVGAKVPFGVARAELTASGFPDTRLGGVGVWFSGCLLLSLVACAALYVRRSLPHKASLTLASACIAVLASAVIHPEAWWARYVPQIWLIPCALAGASFLAHDRISRLIGLALSLALLVNACVTLASATWKAMKAKDLVTVQAEAIRRSGGAIVAFPDGFVGAYERLRQSGVSIAVVRTQEVLPCLQPGLLAAAERIRYCPDRN